MLGRSREHDGRRLCHVHGFNGFPTGLRSGRNLRERVGLSERLRLRERVTNLPHDLHGPRPLPDWLLLLRFRVWL
jgi:hypothetical protein